MDDEQLREALWTLWQRWFDEPPSDDPDLRARCVAELKARCEAPEWYPAAFLSRVARDWFFTDEAIAKGDGVPAVLLFVEWLNATLGQGIE